MRYIGLDLHKTKLQVCYLENRGEKIKYTHKSFTFEEFEQFKASLSPEDYLAFETANHSGWMYHQCKNLVAKIIVLDPYKFRIIADSNKKTDEIDAKAIAYYLSLEGFELPATKVKTQKEQDIRPLA